MIRCELGRRRGAPGGGPNGVPNATEADEDVRDGSIGAAKKRTGGEADGKGLAEAGLGVQLGLEDGEAGVGAVKLAEGVFHEALLPCATGGEGAVEEGLEIADGLKSSLPSP